MPYIVRLKQIRVAAGLTQEDLAALTGFTQSYLSRLERGLGNPRLSHMDTIGSALKTGYADIWVPMGVDRKKSR